jgi:hypothetical protein
MTGRRCDCRRWAGLRHERPERTCQEMVEDDSLWMAIE